MLASDCPGFGVHGQVSRLSWRETCSYKLFQINHFKLLFLTIILNLIVNNSF